MFVALGISFLLATGACTTGGGPGPSNEEPGETALVPDGQLLPAPLAPPAGDPDEAAATLAAQVVGEAPERLPALLAAVRASGIGVRDLAEENRVVLEPAEPSQGLAFQAGEILAMDKLLERDHAVTLADLAEVIRQLDPEVFRDAPVEELLVDGIRTMATDEAPTRRFWGQFIVEIGKQGPDPYDLLTETPESAQLDAVQTMFVLLRLFGDLDANVQPALAARGSTGSTITFADGETATLAAFHPPRPQVRTPCTAGEREAEILEAASVGASFGFGELINYAAEHLPGQGLAKFAAALPWVNAALALIKFFATMATFTGTIELKGGEPLVRTTKTKPGEWRELAVTVRIDTGRSTYLNCLRLILNGAGLDFNLPDDGPVAGAEISWSLLRGGGPGEYVRFCSLGESCVGARNPQVNPVKGITDDKGQTSTGIEGVPQKRDLPDTVTPVEKRAVVRASVNLKPAKLFRDLTDAVSTATAGPGTPVVFTTEMLNRIGFFGAGLNFAVRDWGERWQIEVKMTVVTPETQTNQELHWDGTVDVDPVTGEITGEGTGSLSGDGRLCVIDGSAHPARIDIGGSWGVAFGGEKEGDRFSLSVRGIAPRVKVTGNEGPCVGLKEITRVAMELVAKDPGSVYGVNQFAFDAGARARLETAGGEPYSTLTLTIDSRRK